MSTFEEQYLQLRTKENRIYLDEQISRLPFLHPDEAHVKEWLLRAKTAVRFKQYLETKGKNLNILDIGCGNGWFTNFCFQAASVKKAVGIEVNEVELAQAKRVFEKEMLRFYYWDVFVKPPFQEIFDLITLNAVIQYFEHPQMLFKRLAEFLKPKGEIHLLDSPFYQASEVAAAAERSKNYYTKMGFPEMADFYFHHSINELENFELMYKAPKGKVQRILNPKESPFSWYRIKKEALF